MDTPERGIIASDLRNARNLINIVKEQLPLALDGDASLQLDDLESACDYLLAAYKKIVSKTNLSPTQWDNLFERVKQFQKDLAAFEFFDDVILPCHESPAAELPAAELPAAEFAGALPAAELPEANGKPQRKPRKKKD